MTDVIDRIKSGKANITIVEDDFGPVRVRENPPKLFQLPSPKPEQRSLAGSVDTQKALNRAIKERQEKAVRESHPHVKLKQLPFDEWVRVMSVRAHDEYDACLHLGGRNSLVSWCYCEVCGARTYRVEELHRVVTLGINEQRYERIVYRETWGQTCLVCGWHARKWNNSHDPEYGVGGGWAGTLGDDGKPTDGRRWTKA